MKRLRSQFSRINALNKNATPLFWKHFKELLELCEKLDLRIGLKLPKHVVGLLSAGDSLDCPHDETSCIDDV